MKFTLHFLFFEKIEPVEISGHFPESLGNAGQDTKRRKSKKLFAIRCDSDLEKTEPENKPQKQHCSRKI